MGKLDGKIAVVTGASRGIGEEVAKVFAAEGARVVCVARTIHEGDHQLEGSLERTVREIKDAGGDAAYVAADISLPEECEKLIGFARQTYGPVDVLVNNAALSYHMPLVDYPLNRWMRTWAVNVHAPFILSKLALEDMIRGHGGAIVNISSNGAVGPGRGPYGEKPRDGDNPTYGAEKAAIERLTQGMAQQVYKHGVSVTCVSPSQVVGTPGTVFHGLATGPDDPKSEPPIMMARAVLLLASEPLDKVTGRVTYSQHILAEFGWIPAVTAPERRKSGFSQI